ncbi:MAG: hypothetical protein L3K14_02720 [Thermoplasmata archaeon]|nr:hypothetical protein [Thermoplasmata archaeon]
MLGEQSSPTLWVQLLQALVAREAVEQFGVSSRRIADLLGLAPSAVSQYLSGKRLSRPFLEYSMNERARAIARRTAEHLLQGSGGGVQRTQILLEGAGGLAELSAVPRHSGPRTLPDDSGPSKLPRGMVRWLRRRVRAEQVAVAQCMRLAQKARDELTRAILRQIASDSLRHAEIVASLVPYVDRGVSGAFASGITRTEVEALIEAERAAEAQADGELVRHLHGTMSILVASIEADERKHADLLRGLLASGFPPIPRRKVPVLRTRSVQEPG